MKGLEGGRQINMTQNVWRGAQRRSSKNATNVCHRIEDSLPWDSRGIHLIY